MTVMDFTNINDPAGVKALLDQLRTSQAWQELQLNPDANGTGTGTLQAGKNPPDPGSKLMPECALPPPSSEQPENEPEPSRFVSDRISSLLSRLQPGSGGGVSPLPTTQTNKRLNYDFRRVETPSTSPTAHDPRTNAPPPLRNPSAQTRPLRSLTFSQALPVVARLAEDPTFMTKLEKMRKDQAHLENKLWGERNLIIKNHEEKLKVVLAKAAIIGLGISRSEASALESLFLNELKAYDSEHALPAWDAFVTQQQSSLEKLGVPGMFVSALKTDREKQQRIIQVLDGLFGPENNEDMEP